ncbi:MAG: hypothetical protein ACEQSB_00030 [Undibacterium sp.]
MKVTDMENAHRVIALLKGVIELQKSFHDGDENWEENIPYAEETTEAIGVADNFVSTGALLEAPQCDARFVQFGI